jgi:hypothetical protein
MDHAMNCASRNPKLLAALQFRVAKALPRARPDAVLRARIRQVIEARPITGRVIEAEPIAA